MVGGDHMLTSKEVLSINIKYYRKKYHLSQEQFAEIVGSNLTYINQIENLRRKPTIDMLDKIASGMNEHLKANITAADLIQYTKHHVTHFTRVDEKR